MSTTHTPGPWTTNGYSIGVPAGTIAHMYRPGDASCRGLTQAEQVANARLLCAAPDLLAACKWLRETFTDEYCKNLDAHTTWRYVTAAADRAIAKAEGGAA